jgi:hypothetical protein
MGRGNSREGGGHFAAERRASHAASEAAAPAWAAIDAFTLVRRPVRRPPAIIARGGGGSRASRHAPPARFPAKAAATVTSSPPSHRALPPPPTPGAARRILSRALRARAAAAAVRGDLSHWMFRALGATDDEELPHLRGGAARERRGVVKQHDVAVDKHERERAGARAPLGEPEDAAQQRRALLVHLIGEVLSHVASLIPSD